MRTPATIGDALVWLIISGVWGVSVMIGGCIVTHCADILYREPEREKPFPLLLSGGLTILVSLAVLSFLTWFIYEGFRGRFLS